MVNKDMTNKLVLAGLMCALITLMTMVIQMPIPATKGYIHLGDCMIFFSVLLLGFKFGALAAGVGSALADLFTGYFHYVPITFVVKSVMALIMGLCIEYAVRKGYGKKAVKVVEAIGMIAGGIFMVIGYYIAEVIMIGSFVTPVAAIPMNVAQFAVGAALAMALAAAFYKTPARKIFAYGNIA